MKNRVIMSTLPPRSSTEVLYEDRFVFWLRASGHTSDMTHAAERHKVLSYKLLKIWGRFPNPPTPLGKRQEHDYLKELMQHPPRGACFLSVVQRSRCLRIYLVFRLIDSAKLGE